MHKNPPNIGDDVFDVLNIKVFRIQSCILQIGEVGQYFGMIAPTEGIAVTNQQQNVSNTCEQDNFTTFGMKY